MTGTAAQGPRSPRTFLGADVRPRTRREPVGVGTLLARCLGVVLLRFRRPGPLTPAGAHASDHAQCHSGTSGTLGPRSSLRVHCPVLCRAPEWFSFRPQRQWPGESGITRPVCACRSLRLLRVARRVSGGARGQPRCDHRLGGSQEPALFWLPRLLLGCRVRDLPAAEVTPLPGTSLPLGLGGIPATQDSWSPGHSTDQGARSPETPRGQ